MFLVVMKSFLMWNIKRRFILMKLKKTKIVIGVILMTLTTCMVSCVEEASDKVSDNRLKVLAWNIWHGGHSAAYPGIGCENVIGILKHSDADVHIIIETYGASSMIADTLGFYHRLLSSNLSIYSRYPIVKTYLFPDSISTFNFGGVEIDYKGTRVRVFDTWLHTLPDCRLVPVEKTETEIISWEESGTRDDEIRAILSVLKEMINEADSIPFIVAGDFNTHSHLDWTADTRDLYKHGGAMVNWPVSRLMEEVGFIDSYREINPNPITDIGTTWMYEATEDGGDLGVPDRSDRIDFIYYMGKKLKAVHSEIFYAPLGEELIFKDRKFIYTSDHGFVFTEFEVEGRF